MFNRKTILLAGAALVVLIVIIVLFVLGGRKPPAPAEQTFTVWNLDDEKTVLQSQLEAFQTAHPSIKISYVKKDSRDYLNSVLTEIAKGGGPDVLAVPHDWLPKYHQLFSPMPDGKLANPTLKKSDKDVYAETFPQVVVSDNIIADKIYGMPLSIETLTLYYNPTLLDEALSRLRQSREVDSATQKIFREGPKTWDDFSRIAQIATEKTDAGLKISGAAMGVSQNIKTATDILSALMLQNGAKMVSDDQKTALFNTAQAKFGDISSPGTRALEFYTSFSNRQNANYSWNETMPEARRAFAEEKTAMIIDYAGAKTDIKRLNPDLNYETIPLPQVKETPSPTNFASYNTFVANRLSKNPSLSWDYILDLTNKDNAANYLEATGKSSARLDKISQEDPAYTAASWFKPEPQKAEQIFQQMIDEVNRGASAQTAIDAAAEQISGLLKEISQ